MVFIAFCPGCVSPEVSPGRRGVHRGGGQRHPATWPQWGCHKEWVGKLTICNVHPTVPTTITNCQSPPQSAGTSTEGGPQNGQLQYLAQPTGRPTASSRRAKGSWSVIVQYPCSVSRLSYSPLVCPRLALGRLGGCNTFAGENSMPVPLLKFAACYGCRAHCTAHANSHHCLSSLHHEDWRECSTTNMGYGDPGPRGFGPLPGSMTRGRAAAIN